MDSFTDLLAKLDQRCTKLDQIVEAIADIRRLCPPNIQRNFIAFSRSNQKVETQGGFKFHFKPVPRETALK